MDALTGWSRSAPGVHGTSGRGRLAAAIALALALSVAATAPVLGNPPDREILEPETFTIEGACEFDVLLEDLKVGYAIMTFERPDGSIVIIGAGQWLLRLTNVDTGESLQASISGPEFLTFNGAFSDIGTGRWLQWIPDGGGMYLTSGRFDATGATVQEWIDGLHGHSMDVCAALAS